MSRNLCASGCCGVTCNLSDLRGKPIEFRRYYKEAPHIGTKWTCPVCGADYFAIWHRDDQYDGPSSSRFTIDLSYYESFNDEHGDPLEPGEKPAYLCEDDAKDAYWHWGYHQEVDDPPGGEA